MPHRAGVLTPIDCLEEGELIIMLVMLNAYYKAIFYKRNNITK